MLRQLRRRTLVHARRDNRGVTSVDFTGLRHTEAQRHRGRIFLISASISLVGLAAALAAQVRVPVPGDALPGITPAEFQEFRLGLDDFLEVETSDEGLGPAFNATSCAVCHSVPAVGGMSAIAEVRAGKRGPNGEFIALDPSGESLFHL